MNSKKILSLVVLAVLLLSPFVILAQTYTNANDVPTTPGGVCINAQDCIDSYGSAGNWSCLRGYCLRGDVAPIDTSNDGCTSGALDCTARNQVCNTATDECVNCITDSDCSGNKVCDNFDCVRNSSASNSSGAARSGKSVTLTNPLGNIKTFQQLLARIAAGVGQVITALAAVMIIVSGILYLLSAGNPEKVNTAKKAFFYAIMGIVIGLAATAIVNIIEGIIGVSS